MDIDYLWGLAPTGEIVRYFKVDWEGDDGYGEIILMWESYVVYPHSAVEEIK